MAPPPPAGPTRTISVHGEAELTAPNDQVELRLGVTTTHRSLKRASSDNDARIARVLELARELGLDDSQVRTSDLSMIPQYGYRGRPRIIGFEVRNTLTITLDDPGKLDGLIGPALEAGATDLYGVTFTVQKDDALRERARAAAIEDAVGKARFMAQALGAELGEVLAVREQGVPAAQSLLAVAEEAKPKRAGETVAPGRSSIHAGIYAVFALE
ncbi:MAG: SIMPL domain-containing protein [Myxococcales bacterium]|nr:SIMPL domain-containing protein [Myxococcales bacterium]